ncbi:F-box domain containing protein [Pandoravirus salinus]|uniref:F-box domain containing protein n=1 Tax=Pandoravirus salinus TaxID=1349410 RepID=S4W5N9_9VIRU|nr:F-box domain [Pandoravirus salinus]AGO85690.2 F-box domain containing protein [Pandoravirus salinus]
MDALPDELLCAILSALGPLWLSVASSVSVQWRGCAADVARAQARTDSYERALPLCVTHDLADTAAAQGYLSVVRWLHDDVEWRWSHCAVEGAALGGHYDVIDCMLGQHNAKPKENDTVDGWREYTRSIAVDCKTADQCNGQPERSAPVRQCEITERAILFGLVGGGMALAERLHSASNDWFFHSGLLTVAVALNDIGAVRRLHHLGCAPSRVAVILAARVGRHDMLDAMAITKGDQDLAARLADDRNPDRRLYFEDPYEGNAMTSVIEDILCMHRNRGPGPALAAALVQAHFAGDMFISYEGRACCPEHARTEDRRIVFVGGLWHTTTTEEAPVARPVSIVTVDPAPTMDPGLHAWLTAEPPGPPVRLMDDEADVRAQTQARKQLLLGRDQERRARRRRNR